MSTRTRIALRVAAWTGVGVIGLTTLATFAEARNTSTRQITAQEGQPDKARKPNRDGKGARIAGHGLGRNILHGEAVVKTADGFGTVFAHNGQITAVDGKVITVKSADGYTKTYTLTDATKIRTAPTPEQRRAARNSGQRPEQSAPQLKVGDRVMVHGTLAGGNATVKAVLVLPAEAAAQRDAA